MLHLSKGAPILFSTVKLISEHSHLSNTKPTGRYCNYLTSSNHTTTSVLKSTYIYILCVCLWSLCLCVSFCLYIKRNFSNHCIGVVWSQRLLVSHNFTTPSFWHISKLYSRIVRERLRERKLGVRRMVPKESEQNHSRPSFLPLLFLPLLLLSCPFPLLLRMSKTLNRILEIFFCEDTTTIDKRMWFALLAELTIPAIKVHWNFIKHSRDWESLFLLISPNLLWVSLAADQIEHR